MNPWDARIQVSGLPSYVNEIISKFDYDLEKIVLPHMAVHGTFPVSEAQSMMKDAYVAAGKITSENYSKTYSIMRESLQKRFQEEAEKVENEFASQLRLLKEKEIEVQVKELEVQALEAEKIEREALKKKLLIGAGAASVLFFLFRR